MNELQELTDMSNRLHSLLQDPHPGLFMWNQMLVRVLREICNFWTDGEFNETRSKN